VRRIVLCAARRDRRAFLNVYRHPSRSVRRAQAVSWRHVTRMASLAHGATDRAAEADVAALPARLERVDAWIAEGVLNGSEPTAADFQIAPSIALLLCFEDLRPSVDGRPAARLAQRVVADALSDVGAALPSAWVPPSPDAEEAGPSLLGRHGAPAS
jgi:glutathione S-transferase